ncbi:hypothetical protein OGATHE_004598 [Ogataea polymorpha]|uniref:Uncharacterized protein n=1 Tax=Ogataea polymorpha TaxID=460523 RepID=A0A9P8P0N5_9ASCO|nr:hypothetical protein OGATHE_004598 [Ogataea polymorpha]
MSFSASRNGRKCADTAFSVYERSLYSRWMNWSRSSCMRPSILTTLFSRLPYARELKNVSLISCLLFFRRAKYGKSWTPSARALLIRYGKSKLAMLYPMITSGSTLTMNSFHLSSISSSDSYENVSDPTIGAHDLTVNTLRTNGTGSPALATTFAIWITGSCSASGKMPLRPAHSMSNDRIRNGAMFRYLPSEACDTRSL